MPISVVLECICEVEVAIDLEFIKMIEFFDISFQYLYERFENI